MARKPGSLRHCTTGLQDALQSGGVPVRHAVGSPSGALSGRITCRYSRCCAAWRCRWDGARAHRRGGSESDRASRLHCGTSSFGDNWTLDALARAPGCVGVLEPDNEDFVPSAAYAKRALGRYPCLVPGEESPAYAQLWEWALHGADVNSRIRLAKWILGLSQSRWIDTTWLAANLARNPRAHHEGGTGVPSNG